MSTNIKFTIDNNVPLDKFYIMIEDGGYEIKDEKPNEICIFIPIESRYLVSKKPFLSLRTDNAIDNESISLTLKTYSKYGLYHSYQKDGEYYNFVIYNEGIELIMKSVNNEQLKEYFKDTQFYICISSRFSGITITNHLNSFELPDYYCLIPKSFSNIVCDENVSVSNMVYKYNIDKYKNVLERLVLKQTIDSDSELLNELLDILHQKSNTSIVMSNGTQLTIDKLTQLITSHMEQSNTH